MIIRYAKWHCLCDVHSLTIKSQRGFHNIRRGVRVARAAASTMLASSSMSTGFGGLPIWRILRELAASALVVPSDMGDPGAGD